LVPNVTLSAAKAGPANAIAPANAAIIATRIRIPPAVQFYRAP
jgi:hypothetical protein